MDPPTSELPTGTVTFLFSDIESSTRLVEELATSTYSELIEQHHSLLREIFSGNGGVERGTEGDGFLVVFTDAPSAVKAAVQARRAIEDAEWPEGRSVRVCMGLHTGQGIRGGDDYVGSDIVRAARVAASAHGGQVLISEGRVHCVTDPYLEAATLTGAAEALQVATGARSPLATVVNADMEAAREAIGEESVSRALVESRGMSTEEAVDYATRVLESL